ncbi:MAG TPA: histidine kinase [Burkholderiaceae bacterium]|nr:histidine kinase [Burkholderiaceae bacterium]
MSVVLPRAAALGQGLRGPARWWQSWGRMNRRHLAALALASAAMAMVDATAVIDKLNHPGVSKIMVFDFATSVIIFGLALLAWVAAVDGVPASGRERNVRVVWAVVVAAVLAACIAVPVMHALEVDKLWWEMSEKMKPPPPLALVIFGNAINFIAWTGLFIAAAEVVQRRALTNEAIRATQREQAALARDVLESRLAAMQAQVEPRFLFDTLVDIERLYQRDIPAAASNLDRLITYLRVALPRLREAGSTIAAEFELVQAYLDVVRSLHDGSPKFTVMLPDDCRDARFYPMLLLPLVQRAIRADDSAVPASVRLAVQRTGEQIVIVLRISTPGGCSEDREIARVRERLAGLYGARAELECVELHGDTTQLTMRVPAATA